MDKKGINIEYRDYSLDQKGSHRSAVVRPAQRTHRFSLLQTLLLLVLLVAASGTALTTPLSTANILGDFNAVIYQNGSTLSDMEGVSVIGGNFSGANFYNQFSRVPKNLPSGFGARNVYGSTSGNAINIDNGGNAHVGGRRGGKNQVQWRWRVSHVCPGIHPQRFPGAPEQTLPKSCRAVRNGFAAEAH